MSYKNSAFQTPLSRKKLRFPATHGKARRNILESGVNLAVVAVFELESGILESGILESGPQNESLLRRNRA